MSSFTPFYIEAYQSGSLFEKIEKARQLLHSCEVCPRKCGAERINNEVGFCGTGRHAVVSSYHAHFGEEDPLSGNKGSGTIFFPIAICCAVFVRILKSAIRERGQWFCLISWQG